VNEHSAQTHKLPGYRHYCLAFTPAWDNNFEQRLSSGSQLDKTAISVSIP